MATEEHRPDHPQDVNRESPPLTAGQAEFLKLARYRMPFGKYKDRLLIDLPEPYVVWFRNKGFPNGELGKMLQIVYEVKANGLEYLFKPLRKT
jgi:uncharacterized protein (DUF3820 family)